MKANPPRSRKPWPDRNGPQFRRRVFKVVARASRPSNPASRQISSAVVPCGLSAEIKPVAHLTTVLGGTPETTGRRPVPPHLILKARPDRRRLKAILEAGENNVGVEVVIARRGKILAVGEGVFQV